MTRSRRPLLIATGIVLTLAAACPASAPPEFYDFDSLLYEATAVIEAKLKQPPANPGEEVTDVEVLAVHAGDARVGQTLSIYRLSSFQVSTADAMHPEPLTPGHRLLLLLRPPEAYRHTTAKYAVCGHGVCIVRDGGLQGFTFESIPGPFVTGDMRIENMRPPATVAAVVARWVEVRELARRIESGMAQTPWLTAELRRHAAEDESDFQRDLVAEAMVGALVDRREVDALFSILDMNMSRTLRAQVARGLSAQTSRQRLLGLIADAGLSSPMRVKLARTLAATQAWASRNGQPLDAVTLEAAELTRRVADDEDVAVALVEVFREARPLTDDRPLEVLRAVRDGAVSQRLCYAIDGCDPLPPVISRVSDAKRVAGSAVLSYTISIDCRRPAGGDVKSFLVVRGEDDEAVRRLPSVWADKPAGAVKMNHSGDARVDLGNLPPGHYRISLVVESGGDVLHEGRYGEFDW